MKAVFAFVLMTIIPCGSILQSKHDETPFEVAVEHSGSGFRISNAEFTMTMAGPEQGYRIESLKPAFGDDFDMSANGEGLPAIWRLVFMDEDGVAAQQPGGGDSESLQNVRSAVDTSEWEIHLTAQGHEARTSIEESGDGGLKLIMDWADVPVGGGAVGVVATFSVKPGCRFVRMRITVKNHSHLYLERVDFPYLSGLGPFGNVPENDRLIWPRTTGVLIDDHYRSENREAMQRIYHYPSALQSMQLIGVYGDKGGIYFAAEDPDCWLKRFWYTPSGNNRSVDLYLQNFSAQMGNKGNGYEMHYDAVLGVFEGDWWDAASIYREWALQQPWVPSVTVKHNPRFPESVKQVSAWLKNYQSSIKGVREEIFSLQEKLGVERTALTWYGWNNKRFDTDYPELFPAKSGFRETVLEFRNRGIISMPYINSRLWDTSVDTFDDENASDAAIILASGDIARERYSQRTFAVMNPSTDLWQDKIVSLCGKLVEEYGVGAIYMDQVSAVGALMDYSGSFEGQTGGGNYWVSGYWQMLDKIHERLAGHDIFLTSESFTESYLSRLNGGYLLWIAYGQNTIPFAQAVYGGKTIFWGRWFWMEDFNDEGFYTKLADCLSNNIQLGWLQYPLQKEEYSEQMTFAGRLARLYDKGLRDAFLDGRFIKPPESTGSNNITATWDLRKRPMKVTRPAVTVSAWKMPDSSLRLLVINASEETETISLLLEQWEYNELLVDNTINKIVSSDSSEIDDVTSENRLNVTISGHSAVVYKLK